MANREWETSSELKLAPPQASTLVDPLEHIENGVVGLRGEDRRGWLPQALSDRMREVSVLRERLEVEYLRLIGDWDRVQSWAVVL